MKKALITGITGQDGSYLAEYLLEKNYEVHGMIRRNSVPEHQESRINHLDGNISLYFGDISDQSSINKILNISQPDEIYNLAGQSHVRISFDIPQFTAMTNAIGVLNILEAFKDLVPSSRLYQASSSEMFGNSMDDDQFQRETTPMNPTSPYGCSKLFAYNILRNYRTSYNLFVSNGILFNHESPRRGSNFVTTKVIKAAIGIKNGTISELRMGNLDSQRDWGHSLDYVRAMHAILNHDEPDDFVISTMKTHSVRELCDYVFSRLGLNYQDYVVQDKKYMRPEELKYLRGDSTKARNVLGWKPKYSFESLLDEMIDFWITQEKK